MPVITSIDDLKRIYKRRVPQMFYDYAESGSWTEQTFRENSSDFEQIRLRQKVAVVPPAPAEPAAVTSAPTATVVPPPLLVPEAPLTRRRRPSRNPHRGCRSPCGRE